MNPQAATTDHRGGPIAQPLAVVKHLRGDGLSILDAHQHDHLGHVGAGRQPHSLALHPNQRWLYVPYMGSNSLEVIDKWTLSVQRTLDESETGTAPVGAEVTRNGAYLFISTYGDLPEEHTPGLAVFEITQDGNVEPIAQLPIGKAAGLAIDIKNNVWVALNDADQVLHIRGEPPFQTLDTFSVPGDPQDIVYSPGYGLLGINNVEAGCVCFIDTLDQSMLGTTPAAHPRGGSIDPTVDQWFVGNTEGDGITAIDLDCVRPATKQRMRNASNQIPLGTATAFTDVIPGGGVLVVDAYDNDRVTFVDTGTFESTTQIQTGGSPHHPRFSGDGRTCYVPSIDADTVTVIDTHAIKHSPEDVAVESVIDCPSGSGPSSCFRTDRGELP
jgi:protein NirF